MTMSMVTRSGLSSRKRLTACTPSSASPAMENPALVKMSRSVLRMKSASSTMSTRLWGILRLHQVVDGPLQHLRVDQLHGPLRGVHLRIGRTLRLGQLARFGRQVVDARHLAHVDADVAPGPLQHDHFTFRTRGARLQADQRPEIDQAGDTALMVHHAE